MMTTIVKSQKTTQTQKPVLSVKPKKTSTVRDTQDYQEMIAEAAYYKAEQRGFVAGLEDDDWLAAENEIHSMLDTH